MKKSSKIEKKLSTKKEIYFKKIQKWSKENFSKKNNIIRLISLAIAIVLIIPAGIAMNIWAQNNPKFDTQGDGFFFINVTFNSGLGWSLFENSTTAVYGVQWTVGLLMLTIFLCSRKPYLCVLFALSVVGGFFNVIDRSIIKELSDGSIKTNVVVDYFGMGGFGAIFNVPDIGIVTGTIGGAGVYFIESLFDLSKDYKKNERQKDKEKTKK